MVDNAMHIYIDGSKVGEGVGSAVFCDRTGSVQVPSATGPIYYFET